jgi:hypothetical protein
MYFAEWRNGDDVQTLPSIVEEWKKLHESGGAIDDFILNLGFTRWDYSQQPEVEDPIITAVYVYNDPHTLHIGGGLHCRFLILWQNPENFGLFFAATTFDMFAIVREIHDYEKHMADTVYHRYYPKGTAE